jgi:hypothetical protein
MGDRGGSGEQCGGGLERKNLAGGHLGSVIDSIQMVLFMKRTARTNEPGPGRDRSRRRPEITDVSGSHRRF